MDIRLRLKPNPMQFQDFTTYFYSTIMSNKKVVKAGICTVVPPENVWLSPSEPILEKTFKLTNVQQHSVIKVTDGVFLQYKKKIKNGRKFTPISFFEKSKEFTNPSLSDIISNVPNVERELTSKQLDKYQAQLFKNVHLKRQLYGFDFEQTLFSHGQISWNLREIVKTNEIRFSDSDSPGVNIPMLIFGTDGSTFIMHTENKNLAAINFLHWGAEKVWFAIPNKYYLRVLKLFKELYGECGDPRKNCNNFLSHKLCLIDPTILDKHGIPYTRVSGFLNFLDKLIY